MMNADTNYILNETPDSRRWTLPSIIAVVALAVASAVFAAMAGGQPTSATGFGAPPAGSGQPAHLDDRPAPATEAVTLASGSNWEFQAQGRDGKICEITVTERGSGSACANPQETEPLGISETGRDGEPVHLLSGWTVSQAKTIVFEFADGTTAELEALGHPTLGRYKFFVTEFQPSIVGVVAMGANGTEVARASYQTMRFLTER